MMISFFSLIKMLKKYPLIHPDCEKDSHSQCPDEINEFARFGASKGRCKISIYHIDQSLLRAFCISKGGGQNLADDTWVLNEVTLKPCQHEMPR